MKYLVDAFPYLQRALDHFQIYELFGASWDEVSGEFCYLFGGICDSVGFKNVPLGPYVNEYSATLQNMRAQSSVSVK